MASIDKAAIGFSIAIVAIGVVFAFYHSTIQEAVPAVTTPMVSKTVEPKAAAPSTSTQADPFADIAAKVKESSSQEKAAPQTAAPQTAAPQTAAPQTAAPQTAAPQTAAPQTAKVTIPTGTSSPGCDETKQCFVPSLVTINAGDSIEWSNEDTAAHTVTSGSPADGPSGEFDSSLIMGGASFAYTFDETGTYDYFCMVHPWMTGEVQVN
jgi:plastocyanin